jgi:hypothetical protein
MDPGDFRFFISPTVEWNIQPRTSRSPTLRASGKFVMLCTLLFTFIDFI